MVSVGGQFPHVFRRITSGTVGTPCLGRISARGNWVENFVLCVLRLFITYSFTCLLFLYSYIHILFILRELFIGSFISSVVKRRVCVRVYLCWVWGRGVKSGCVEGGAIYIKLCSDFSEIALAHFSLLWVCCSI